MCEAFRADPDAIDFSKPEPTPAAELQDPYSPLMTGKSSGLAKQTTFQNRHNSNFSMASVHSNALHQLKPQGSNFDFGTANRSMMGSQARMHTLP